MKITSTQFWKIILIISALFVLTEGLFIVDFIFRNNKNTPQKINKEELLQSNLDEKIFDVSVMRVVDIPQVSNFLFFGDLMLDRNVLNQINKNSLEYLFEKLDEEKFFDNYNLISANLEGAVIENGQHYAPNNLYDFAFDTELVGKLKNYNFNFFTLANNHFTDQGDRGVEETRKNLDELKFDYTGCEDKEVGDCSVKILEINKKKIAMLGFSMVYGVFDETKAVEIINKIKAETDLVIVNIHWGVEYEHYFNKKQKQVGYDLVDAGADIIIGHHPHVVQGLEIYKNKPIFYSLGNFVFDQYFSVDTQESLAVSIKVLENKFEFILHPLKSQKSQASLMSEEDKNKFLNKFISWSELPEDMDLSSGEFVLNYE